MFISFALFLKFLCNETSRHKDLYSFVAQDAMNSTAALFVTVSRQTN